MRNRTLGMLCGYHRSGTNKYIYAFYVPKIGDHPHGKRLLPIIQSFARRDMCKSLKINPVFDHNHRRRLGAFIARGQPNARTRCCISLASRVDSGTAPAYDESVSSSNCHYCVANYAPYSGHLPAMTPKYVLSGKNKCNILIWLLRRNWASRQNDRIAESDRSRRTPSRKTGAL